jgi:hypothetical protein
MSESKHWQFDIGSWLDESKKFFWRISEIREYNVRRDLFGMYHTLDNLSIEIMREEVRSKLFTHESNEHKKLIAKFNEYHQNLIEQLTYGLLCS